MSALAIGVVFAGDASAQQIGYGSNCDESGRPEVRATADRASVRAGESVTLTASGTSSKNEPISYMWRAERGKIFGSGSSVRFDTTGLTAGRYDVVLMGRGTSCGTIRYVSTIEVASCPDLTLTADSLSVTAGQTVELSASGYAAGSNYSWSASSGRVDASGSTARLDTTGASSGPITVTLNAVDSDCTANQQLVVNVQRLEPLPPSTLFFNSNDSRLDNADKAQLDDSSLRLGSDVTSKVVIVGNSTSGQRAGVARKRAERTRDYLVNEKGVDPSRVVIRANEGTAGADSVDVIIVPAGAEMPMD